MAGAGIEYAWGKIKYNFRAQNSAEGKAKDGLAVEERLRQLIQSPDCIPVQRIWKYERRTRDYMRLYLEINRKILVGEMSLEDISFKKLETMRKVYTTHRNIAEIERSFIQED